MNANESNVSDEKSCFEINLHDQSIILEETKQVTANSCDYSSNSSQNEEEHKIQ